MQPSDEHISEVAQDLSVLKGRKRFLSHGEIPAAKIACRETVILLSKHSEIMLRSIDPNKMFVVNVCSRLSTDVKLDEQTRQQLLSLTLTNYEKNDVILRWLNRASQAAFDAFLSALRDSQQQHLANLLLGAIGDQLLSDTKRRQLLVGAVQLAKSLTSDTKFLAVMKSSEALSDTDYERMITEPINFKRNLLLIDVLLRGTDSTFQCFLNAVEKTKQPDSVRQMFAGHSQSEHSKLKFLADSELQQAWNRLQSHGDIFMRCVDPNGCLVMDFAAQLCQCDCELDEVTRQKLMSPVLTNYDKNCILLEWLRCHPPNYLDAFLRAAKSNKQQHVVNLLLANTAQMFDQPLTEKMRNHLTRITPLLAKLLDFTTVSEHLKKKEAVNWTQWDTMMAERSEYDRNVHLIDALQQGSLHSLLRTTEALKDASMESLSHCMLNGKVVALHVDLDGPNKDELDLEKIIVDKLTEYIHHVGDKDIVAELDSLLAGLSLVAVRKVNSLLLYLYCESVSDMYTLARLLGSGRLKDIIEAVFNTLSNTSTGLNVSVQLQDQKQFYDCYNQLCEAGQ